LVEEASAGEEIVIAKAGKPLVKLVPVSAFEGPRTLGVLAGMVEESPDCWGPDEELEASFYAPAVEPAPVRRVAEPSPRRAKRGKR
jgi:antitoxin (DNA-binding transcriptional repressor) of toxin-antitoxin stability system